MKTMNWTRWLAVGGVALLALALGANLLVTLLWGRAGGWGYNGCGWNDLAMTLASGIGMGGWGSPGMMGFNPVGWIGMILMGLFPLGLIVVLVAGGVWLVQALTRNAVPPTAAGPSRACPNCGQPAQTDWRNCPHCGAQLA